MTPGIYLVHKHVGPTSFALVQGYVQSAGADPERRPRRICHGGALDSFASGLLLVLVEPATRLFDYLHAIPKTYEATVRWGIETDTGNHLGQIIATGDASGLHPRQLDDALATFIGWHDQIPPVASAKRVDGERAYIRAGRGETFVMPASPVYLHEARWLDHDLPRESRLRLTARGGYYVRALARDVGRLVGCGAHLTQLHRSAIGPWTDPGPDRSVELHGRDILPWAAVRILSDQHIGDLRQGRDIGVGELLAPDWPLPPDWPDPHAPVRGFHLERFCFLLKRQDELLKLLRPLRGGL
jgi:tRNA pseudouridine55 synthase